MGNDVVEYVRGISVVKIFGQTAFHLNHLIMLSKIIGILP